MLISDSGPPVGLGSSFGFKLHRILRALTEAWWMRWMCVTDFSAEPSQTWFWAPHWELDCMWTSFQLCFTARNSSWSWKWSLRCLSEMHICNPHREKYKPANWAIWNMFSLHLWKFTSAPTSGSANCSTERQHVMSFRHFVTEIGLNAWWPFWVHSAEWNLFHRHSLRRVSQAKHWPLSPLKKKRADSRVRVSTTLGCIKNKEKTLHCSLTLTHQKWFAKEQIYRSTLSRNFACDGLHMKFGLSAAQFTVSIVDRWKGMKFWRQWQRQGVNVPCSHVCPFPVTQTNWHAHPKRGMREQRDVCFYAVMSRRLQRETCQAWHCVLLVPWILSLKAHLGTGFLLECLWIHRTSTDVTGLHQRNQRRTCSSRCWGDSRSWWDSGFDRYCRMVSLGQAYFCTLRYKLLWMGYKMLLEGHVFGYSREQQNPYRSTHHHNKPKSPGGTESGNSQPVHNSIYPRKHLSLGVLCNHIFLSQWKGRHYNFASKGFTFPDLVFVAARTHNVSWPVFGGPAACLSSRMVSVWKGCCCAKHFSFAPEHLRIKLSWIYECMRMPAQGNHYMPFWNTREKHKENTNTFIATVSCSSLCSEMAQEPIDLPTPSILRKFVENFS